MGATKLGTVLQALDLDPSIIESLPEPVLSELVGFIEYDSRLAHHEDEQHEDDERRRRETVTAGRLSPSKPAFWAHNRVSWRNS